MAHKVRRLLALPVPDLEVFIAITLIDHWRTRI